MVDATISRVRMRDLARPGVHFATEERHRSGNLVTSTI
jgi:hypothetical protein